MQSHFGAAASSTAKQWSLSSTICRIGPSSPKFSILKLTTGGAYQARELSYVFDLIDARVFAALLDHHVLVFVPLSGVLGLSALSAVYFWGARRVLALNGVMASMLLSLFLSCIVVQASTPILYRSSKIILCIALLAFLFYTFSLLQREKRSVTALKAAALFFLGLVMALCDRQGFYYLISATFVVLILWLIAKVRGQSAERCYFRVIFVNAAAIGATIFYNRIFAPWLIYALNGYWPNFSYQQLPWSKLLDPALPAKTWHLFQQQVSFFFGNAPFLVLASIIVVAAIGIAWKWRRAINRNHLTLLAVSVVSIIAIIGLLATMIAPSGRLFYPRSFVLVLHVDGARCDSLWSQRVAQFSQSARPLASQPAHLCHDRNSDCR